MEYRLPMAGWNTVSDLGKSWKQSYDNTSEDLCESRVNDNECFFFITHERWLTESALTWHFTFSKISEMRRAERKLGLGFKMMGFIVKYVTSIVGHKTELLESF